MVFSSVIVGALGLLSQPPPRVVGRREALVSGAAAIGGLLLPPGAVIAADDTIAGLEMTVSLAALTSNLASAPQREVVITGANSGVGLAGAKLLTAAGHRVLCACRTQAKAEAAAQECNSFAAKGAMRSGGSARGAECDLASLSSVRAFADSLRSARVDSLVLNAGLARGTSEAEPRRTADGFEETIGVNHLGHFLLANLLTPTLATAAKPRLIITASPVHDPASGGGNVGSTATLRELDGLAAGPGFSMVDGGAYDPDKAYKDSKLCNMMFMAEAARRLEAKGIVVNAFSPGLIADPNGFFRNQNQLFAKVCPQYCPALPCAAVHSQVPEQPSLVEVCRYSCLPPSTCTCPELQPDHQGRWRRREQRVRWLRPRLPCRRPVTRRSHGQVVRHAAAREAPAGRSPSERGSSPRSVAAETVGALEPTRWPRLRVETLRGAGRTRAVLLCVEWACRFSCVQD
jgi:protochlorophyllide reductase